MSVTHDLPIPFLTSQKGARRSAAKRRGGRAAKSIHTAKWLHSMFIPQTPVLMLVPYRGFFFAEYELRIPWRLTN